MNSYWKKTISIASILLILIVACFVFETRSIIDKYEAHKKEYSDKQETLLASLDRLDIFQKISKNNEEFKAKSDEVKTLWPETAEVSKFMVQTEDLAKQKNFVIQNFSIQEKKISKSTKTDSDDDKTTEGSSKESTKSKSTSITQFSFNTTTPYTTGIDLVRSMETFSRFNSISSISISAKDGDLIDINLTGRLYYGK